MAQITGLCGESEAPVGIFVYGTLRNDSGSTAAYTAKFNEGCVSVPAILKDARMYFDSHYPFVTLGQEGTVHGLLVFPPNLDAKVREADKIEQEGVLYYRCVVPVYPDGGEESVAAYVYVRDVTDSCAVPVPTGDWVTCDKTELTVSALCALEPTLIADTVRRALLKSNCDVRLAKSFMKWGIV